MSGSLIYNGIEVPESIRVECLSSAFPNSTDFNLVRDYAISMAAEDNLFDSEFPPITGFPSVVTEDDIGKELIPQLDFDSFDKTGENNFVTEDDIGKIIWMITDGHHRAFAARMSGKEWFDVVLDPNCITSSKDLDAYNKFCSN